MLPTDIIPFDPPPPSGGESVRRVSAAVTAAEQVLGECSRLIRESLGEEIRTISSQANLAAGLIEGQIAERVGRYEEVLVRCGRKIFRDCEGVLGNVYGLFAVLGIVYPTEEQVVYGLSTGDYLGSLGVTEPEYEPEPMPVPVAGKGVEPSPPPPAPPPAPVEPWIPDPFGFFELIPNLTYWEQNPGAVIPIPDVVIPWIYQFTNSAGNSPQPIVPIPVWGSAEGNGAAYGTIPSRVTWPGLEYPEGAASWNGPYTQVYRTSHPNLPGTSALGISSGGWSAVGGTTASTGSGAINVPPIIPPGVAWMAGPASGVFSSPVMTQPYGTPIGPGGPPTPPPPPPPPPPPEEPKPATCPPDKPPIFPDWRQPGSCALNEAQILDTLRLGSMLGGSSSFWNTAGSAFETAFPFSPQGVLASVISSLFTTGGGSIGGEIFTRVWEWLVKVACPILEINECGTKQMLPAVLFRAIAGLGNLLTGGAFNMHVQQMDHTLNWMCPTGMPSAAEATMAHLKGEISKDTWNCWQAINGQAPGPSWEILRAQQTKPTIGELIELRRRDFLTDEQFEQELRKQGIIDQRYRDAFKQFLPALPGVADVIRFLVRDVSDPQIEQRFRLSEDFESKWQGDLVRYATSQGVSRELAEFYWKAHWRLPSPTQLYEMVHRLRPGRVPAELQVTIEDARTALKQDDVLPFWVDRFLEIAYQPVNRTDLQAAYDIFTFGAEELKQRYLDLGYNDDSADLLVKFATRKRERKYRVMSGAMTPKEASRLYARGTFSKQELGVILQDAGLDAATRAKIEADAEFRRKVRIREGRIKSIRRAFVRGRIDRWEASDLLNDAGVDPQVSVSLIDEWLYDSRLGTKLISAAQACKMHSQGLISTDQHHDILTRLGYDEIAVERMQGSCFVSNDERKRRLAEQKLRQLEADARRIQAEEERKKKEAEKKAEKIRKEMEKLAKEEQELELIRQKIEACRRGTPPTGPMSSNPPPG